ncbi:hypothetical protein RM553_03125 [Zunongwangia sp. F363]|uniref:Uncharacterized protein n=1 Tax=Autumnicola tepida TaxID=3075595 RepID=A0ABU3C650_9FLAO|nr:hypothetical protein [Zunongwangia sp. F363]MDT0641816.1 hypothetical protein [Zunongwangia sp. F363]
MSRLYYETNEVTGFRASGKQEKGRVKSYLEKVSSLVPAEIIAGYLAMLGFLDKEEGSVLVEKQGLLIGIFCFCLLLTPLYLNYQAKEGKPRFIHLLISSVAFIIWAYVTSGEKFRDVYYDADVASVLLIAFSLLSGIIPLKK